MFQQIPNAHKAETGPIEDLRILLPGFPEAQKKDQRLT